MSRILFLLTILFSSFALSAEVIFEENFNSAASLKQFKHWSPTGSDGKLEFDAKEGHNAPGCAVFSVSMRAGLAIDMRKHKPLGGFYRFSCYAQSDTPGMGTMIMRMFPCVNSYLVKVASHSLPLRINKDWTYHEGYLQSQYQVCIERVLVPRMPSNRVRVPCKPKLFFQQAHFLKRALHFPSIPMQSYHELG